MPAYLVAFVEIHDRKRFANDYVPGIPASLEPYGGRILAACDEPKALEGAVPPGRAVILEFPDPESARKWYESDAYAPLLALRLSISTAWLAAVPGGIHVKD